MPVTLANPLIKLADLNPVLRNTNDTGVMDEKVGPQALLFRPGSCRMWFEAVDDDVVGPGGFDFRTGPMLAYALTPQGPWGVSPSTLLITPNTNPDWENGEISPSSIVERNDLNRLELFYHGGNNSLGRESGLLYSTDGLLGMQWVRSGSSPIVAAGAGGAFDEIVADLKVRRLADGSYLGFYRGTNSGGVFTIGRVTGTSAAGLTKQGQVITQGSAGQWNENGVCPGAWYKDPEGRLHLFAATIVNGVGYYYSDNDGASFTQYGSNPVLGPGAAGSIDLDAGDVTQGELDGDVFVISYGGENSVDFPTNPPARGACLAITPARVASPTKVGRFFLPTVGGTRSYRSVSGTSALSQSRFTIAFRFKAYRTARATARVIFCDSAAFNIQLIITIQQTSNGLGGRLCVFYRTPTAWAVGALGGNNGLVSLQTVDDALWHDVVFTRTAADAFQLRVDKQLVDVSTTNTSTDATASTKSIGNADAATGEPDNPFQGTISDFVQINGQALDWDDAIRVLRTRTFPSGVSATIDFPTAGTDNGDVATVEAKEPQAYARANFDTLPPALLEQIGGERKWVHDLADATTWP